MQELSSSYCHRSVRRINQVVNVLTVLVGQGVFTAPTAQYQITQHSRVEEHKIDNTSMHVCKEARPHIKDDSLQDECDQSDGLHCHIVLFIQGHGYYTVLS